MRNLIIASFVFFLLFYFPNTLKSQDTLILKDGRKIFCKIQNIDSTNVYFNFDKDLNTVNTFVKLEEVSKIVYPQKVRKNKSFSLQFGGTFPSGSFASNDINSITSGHAGKGFSFNVVYRIYLNKYFGLNFKYSNNSSEFKTDNYRNYLSADSGLTAIDNKVTFKSTGIFLGPSVIIPIDKLSLYAHCLFGYGNLKLPAVNYILTTGSNNSYVIMGAVTSYSVLLDFGGGLIFSINKNWNMVANINYLRGSFKYNKYIASDAAGTRLHVNNSNQNYSLYSFTLGLELKF